MAAPAQPAELGGEEAPAQAVSLYAGWAPTRVCGWVQGPLMSMATQLPSVFATQTDRGRCWMLDR